MRNKPCNDTTMPGAQKTGIVLEHASLILLESFDVGIPNASSLLLTSDQVLLLLSAICCITRHSSVLHDAVASV